ncbi:imidazole glycerol phosphate synthase subunit HisH [Oleiagrimonas sp. C23AA]|uniref:imidazole glycerol phosphate synthase subunit HisH n=1 Tax=Oleiagrimonas sp. C23AA TaxID=2719047 RepID=UPI00141E6763|nr:imidazole glycerol phosphate synthase subunit HisH [Oleiagrimonas sp. C23AA]NII10335.1 imidazole glycerol phosphate synthase subunit HisH [Oleiagrimonas sp. C23AA]
MAEVVLIDAGGTNIGSVRYALSRLGVDAQMSDDPARIRAATHVILPGVGAAGPGMARLRASGLDAVIRGLDQPVLGVCLGMQLLFEHSEEGEVDCLGLIPGQVRRFADDGERRVPHMGWNRLKTVREDDLSQALPDEPYAYFVHSYYVPQGEATLLAADYGVPISAMVRHRNFCGMQFHPERSAALGAELLRRFLDLPAAA